MKRNKEEHKDFAEQLRRIANEIDNGAEVGKIKWENVLTEVPNDFMKEYIPTGWKILTFSYKPIMDK